MPILTLHDPASARAWYAAGLWRPEAHYDLMAAHAETRPDAWALRDRARHLTWAGLRDRADAAAAAFAAAGLARGERVALRLSNRVEAVVAFLACSRLGLVCNPSLHQNYTNAEVLTLLERIGARALVLEDGYGDEPGQNLAEDASRLAGLRRVFRVPEGRGEAPDLAGTTPPPVVSDADAVCYLAFTSGTTGMPKAVMHSANTLLANARDMVRDWRHGPQTRILSLSPLSHHIAWVAVSQALFAGAELVINDPPEGVRPLDWILETGATYVMGVPTHAMDILADRRSRRLDGLGEVDLFYMAGAPIPPVVAEEFLSLGVRPQNVYGMTENSSHQYTHPDDAVATIVGTTGRGGPAYEVAIFDAEDRNRRLGPGEVGEIGGRGAALMLGYFANQEATEASFNRDGWFMSGDLGTLDADGNLAIVGRLKDVIIRGGKNIYPKKLEDLAMTHGSVAKAAAFPVPDERLGERACLAVLAREGTAPDADSLLAHLHASGLSIYDMPEYFLVMPSFPLTASGKILKRELAEWAKSGRILPSPCRFSPVARRAG